ncbi:TonB family protein [Candidatus Poribacteria bacterium]|nr:TonB family protein [Candidatus Poribacteria bacterium]
MVPLTQYDYIEAKKPKVYDKMLNYDDLKATSPVHISKPPASSVILHNHRENILKIYDELSSLSLQQPTATHYGIDSAGSWILKNFLRTISKKIEKSKRYPKWAMDANVEGKVVIRFTILQDGRLSEEIMLVSSSGAKILDNAAISAVRNASPFPELPKELKSEKLQVELPMSFYLTRS